MCWDAGSESIWYVLRCWKREYLICAKMVELKKTWHGWKRRIYLLPYFFLEFQKTDVDSLYDCPSPFEKNERGEQGIQSDKTPKSRNPYLFDVGMHYIVSITVVIDCTWNSFYRLHLEFLFRFNSIIHDINFSIKITLIKWSNMKYLGCFPTSTIVKLKNIR